MTFRETVSALMNGGRWYSCQHSSSTMENGSNVDPKVSRNCSFLAASSADDVGSTASFLCQSSVDCFSDGLAPASTAAAGVLDLLLCSAPPAEVQPALSQLRAVLGGAAPVTVYAAHRVHSTPLSDAGGGGVVDEPGCYAPRRNAGPVR